MPELLPARMLNEYAYCPRLFYLEWIERQWADSADTIEGRHVHRRVDATEHAVPSPAEERPALHARSVRVSDESLRLLAVIDVVEAEGLDATPVDYKKGAHPTLPERAWEPERVQLCAQGLLLRAHGFRSERGFLWFAESKTKVEVVFDEALVARTLALRDDALARRVTPACAAAGCRSRVW